MWQSKEVRFALDHPTAAGHFPGRPVIPGVLLLDEAIKHALAGVEGPDDIVLRAAKFHRPVRPGDTVVIRWQTELQRIVKFECRLVHGNSLVASGTIQAPADPR